MKTCPFCDSKDIELQRINASQNDHRVVCKHCGAMGPSSGNSYDAGEYWDNRDRSSFNPEWMEDPYVCGTPTTSGDLGLFVFILLVMVTVVYVLCLR